MDYFAPTTTTNSSAHGSYSNSSSTTNNATKKVITKGKSKGVKLSTDPQSVAARERRHRISDRFKILQSLVPGGTKMDTVSMLEEAICYVKFLKTQIWLHQNMINFVDDDEVVVDPSMFSYLPAHHLQQQQQQQDHFYGQGGFLGGAASVHPTPSGLNVPSAEYPTVSNNVEAYMKYFS